MNKKLTHLNANNDPQMVDVSAKGISQRIAKAASVVKFTPEAWQVLSENKFRTAKGSIFDVARVAGTMAVKNTAQLIPFCHPLPILGCKFDIEILEESTSLKIICEVKTEGKTGVEMEALTGASAAALTLYDMTKSLGPETIIDSTRLLSKTGGKSDYNSDHR